MRRRIDGDRGLPASGGDPPNTRFSGFAAGHRENNWLHAEVEQEAESLKLVQIHFNA